jgi:hypothetical protein
MDNAFVEYAKRCGLADISGAVAAGQFDAYHTALYAWEAATKAEREACAKLADEIAFGPYELSGREIGEAIRAR